MKLKKHALHLSLASSVFLMAGCGGGSSGGGGFSALPPPASSANPAPAPAPAAPSVPTPNTPSDPAPVSLDLPRIPWEGGPAYYARFPQAVAGGWTSPGFFPITVWAAVAETQQDIDADKEIGINTYLELFGTLDMALIRNNGMFAIHSSPHAPGLGSETVGWLLSDEPEQYGQGPGEVQKLLEDQAKLYPPDGRMRLTNFTGNMLFPTTTPGEDIAANWLDVNDVVSLDVYWYGRDLHCAGSKGGEVWTDGSGPPQRDGSGHNDLSPAECHRPSNYGYQIDEQRRLAAFSGKSEPVWTFVENGSPFLPSDSFHYITPDQMAGGVWNSLIHEARGVNYFNHSYSGDCISSNNFRDPVFNGRDCYTAMRAKAKEVNGRIKQLAPVLNTQSYRHTFDARLDTMLKASGDSFYIFAMPAGIKGGSATGTHTLQLPAGLNGATAEVLFENRTVAIGANRQIVDSFDAPHTVHIYKITPG